MSSALRVLALFAHPDDAEFLCVGTLALLAEGGASLHIATMTAGDCGSTILPPAKIARIRQREAKRAADLLGASYTCLGEKDLLILYNPAALRKVMGLVRWISPDLVFTHSPSDYMVDHETTSQLCQTACFGACAPNFRASARRGAKPLRSIPTLYYAQPIAGKDILGKEIRPSVCVNIAGTLERKEKILACHESQAAWLRAQQGVATPAELMRQMAARCGELSGFSWAEGFRQHLGQGFPQENLLGAAMGDLVRALGD